MLGERAVRDGSWLWLLHASFGNSTHHGIWNFFGWQFGEAEWRICSLWRTTHATIIEPHIATLFPARDYISFVIYVLTLLSTLQLYQSVIILGRYPVRIQDTFVTILTDILSFSSVSPDEGQNSSIKFQISAKTSAVLTYFRDFPQSLQTNSRMVPQIMPRPLPSSSFPIYYPLNILWVTDSVLK
jgi:hypothetical protein